ncbi:MAG: hypothetical protein FJY73_08210 [Candidatus Eisenbacteria bacterium]|nr:hypothetical protein [Candidatus Eisenbacteria bacterium]
MRRFVRSSAAMAVFAALLLLFAHGWAFAEDDHPDSVDCSACKLRNSWVQRFCIQCGGSLDEEKAAAIRDEIRAGEIPSSRSVDGMGVDPAPESGKPERKKNAPGITKILESNPVNLPRLFNIPTAEVLGSLRVYSTGGGALGVEKERSLFGRLGLGLGDVADIEVASQSVINALRQGSSSFPTSAFRVRLLRERRTLPALALALRGTTNWQRLEGSVDTVDCETRLTKLYAVSSKQIGPVGLHAGVGLTDVRVRDPHGWSFADPNEGELRRNLWAPFGGFLVRANPNAFFLAEVEGLPSYRFQAGAANDEEDIETVWVGVFGVRFFFTRWLVTDTGVRYRSDFVGIADASIQANVTLLLDLSGVRR